MASLKINRKKSYQQSFKRFGFSPKSLQWQSQKAQLLRFYQITNSLDFDHRSILDVGCGFGDILPLLSKSFHDFTFTGVDLVPEFINLASSHYPQHQFFIHDYFADPLPDFYDIIICSGALNSRNLSMSARFKIIKIMFDNCRYSLAFNMSGAHPQPKNIKSNKVFYADSAEVCQFVATLTSNYIFLNQYHPKDFTFILYH